MDKIKMFEELLTKKGIRFEGMERNGIRYFDIYFDESQNNISARMYEILKSTMDKEKREFSGRVRYDNKNARTYNGKDKINELSFSLNDDSKELDSLIAMFNNIKEESNGYANLLILFSILESLGFICEGLLSFNKSGNICRIEMCQTNKSSLTSSQVNALLKIFNDNGFLFERNHNWYAFLSADIKESISNERSSKNDFKFEVEAEDLDKQIAKLVKEIERFSHNPSLFADNVGLRYKLLNLLDGISVVAKKYSFTGDRFHCFLEFDEENMNTIANAFAALKNIPGISLQFDVSMRDNKPIYSISMSVVNNVEIDKAIKSFIGAIYCSAEIDNEYTKLFSLLENFRDAGFACGGVVYNSQKKTNKLKAELEIYQIDPGKTDQQHLDDLFNSKRGSYYVEKISYVGGYSPCSRWGNNTYEQIQHYTNQGINNAEITLIGDINIGLNDLLDISKEMQSKQRI